MTRERNAFAKRLKRTAATRFPSLWVRWRLMRRPRSAERELRLLKNIVGKDDTTVDVGANLGLYTRELASLSAKVHAFEPSHDMTHVLRRASAANVEVHEVALSDRDGEAELRIPRSGDRLTHGLASIEPDVVSRKDSVALKVPRRRLDAEIDDDVTFVKVDVEGHELNVLEGARELVDRCRPVFLVEAEERHRREAVASIADFFHARNYDGYFLRGDAVCGIDQFDARADQDETVLKSDGGRRGERRYVNNFFFVPAERNGRALLAGGQRPAA